MATGILFRPRAGRAQSSVLVLLLLVTFAITAVLTYEAQDAASAHRDSVEAHLRDGAGIAVERYADVSTDAVLSLFTAMFEHQQVPAVGAFPKAELSAKYRKQCNCNPIAQASTHFFLDFRTGESRITGEALDEKTVEWLKVQTRYGAHEGLRRNWQFGIREAAGRVFLFGVALEDDTIEVAAIGIVAPASMMRAFFQDPVAFNLFLLRREPRRDRFAITVRTQSGAEIIPWTAKPSMYLASHLLPTYFGSLTIEAAVPASEIAGAGSEVPPTRLPLLIGLLVMTSLLIAASLVLVRREAELAQAHADFVSGVSHELRTPLAQIRMFAETLLLGRVRNESERRRSLEIIDQEAKRLTHLVDNVLQLSRIERGNAQLSPAATELAPLVRETVETFAQLPRSRNMEFRLEVEDRLVAIVDPGAVKQVLDNLLDNAVKYGPPGQRVLVGLALFDSTAKLWVDDEGAGIPQRERERIFELFYRAPSADAKIVGTGIGLAVVRELATLLEGSVHAEEAPGGGARLVVQLPQAYLRPADAAVGWAVA